MDKIRKGDTVIAIAGKDKGKTGKVIRLLPKSHKAVVERINVVKKAMRRRSEEQHSNIVEVEKPIHISNILLFCKNCNRGTRVGFTILKDGTKSRFCKRCQEVF
jgi:large subunit ribosomal protein L24